jgi:hypothetical protein
LARARPARETPSHRPGKTRPYSVIVVIYHAWENGTTSSPREATQTPSVLSRGGFCEKIIIHTGLNRRVVHALRRPCCPVPRDGADGRGRVVRPRRLEETVWLDPARANESITPPKPPSSRHISSTSSGLELHRCRCTSWCPAVVVGRPTVGGEKAGAPAGGGRGHSPDAVHELHTVTSQLPPSSTFVGSEPEGRVAALLHHGQVREAAGLHERWKATAGRPACSSLLCCPGRRRGARADEDAAVVAFFCG